MLRVEGLAEQAGDFVAVCTGGAAGTQFPVTLTVALNANVTSRIVDAATSTTEALLLIDEPAQPVLGTNIFQGVRTSPNVITFTNVPFTAPGPGTRTIRITNVRVNARQIGVASQGTTPNQVVMFFSASGASALPINNPQRIVGFVVPGISFSLRTAADEPVQTMTFGQAGGQNAPLALSPAATGGSVNYLLKFTEGSTGAFRKRNTSTTALDPSALAPQNIPGQTYNTESGLYNGSLPVVKGLNTAGLATQGTRLMARFAGLPAGVALYVTANAVPGQGSSTVAARLIAADASGGGQYNPVAATTTAGAEGAQVEIAPVTLSNGAGTAVWEVLDASAGAVEQVSFGVVAAYVSPQGGAATVRADFAPLSSAGESDASSPVPRFGEAAPLGACAQSPCLSAPGAIVFSYQAGGPSPSPAVIPVNSTRTPLSFTVSASSSEWFDVAPPNPWLNVSATSGVTPATLSVSTNPAGLADGIYPGTITITSPGAANSPLRIFVLLVVRVPLNVAPPFSCVTNAGVPPIIRAEGLAELTGDVVLNCSGGTAGAVINTDIRISLSTNVTSRIVDSSTSLTEALLFLDELTDNNGVPVIGRNAFQGVLAAPNTITFQNIPMRQPGAGFRTSRITNVRANARQIASSLAAVLSTVVATIAVPGASVSAPQQTVAFIEPGLLFSVRSASGDIVPGIMLMQPGGPNTALLSSANATGGVIDYLLRFQEIFSTAFKKRSAGNQSLPGAVYNTESGFFRDGLTAGQATQGTRLMARFSGIPPGVALYVSVNRISNAGADFARLVATDSSGGGVYSPVPPTTTASIRGTSVGIAPVALSAGAGIAVWEVLDANPTAMEQFDFGLLVAYAAPSNLGPRVEGRYAPFSAAGSADSTSPVPRFAAADCSGGQKCLFAPPVISFPYQVGSALPAPMQVQVTSTGAPVAFTAGKLWSSWLSVSPASGTTPAQLTVTVTPPSYTGSASLSDAIVLVSPDAANSPLVVPVFLTITNPAGAPLAFIPVPPCRVADTRLAPGPFGGPQMSGGTSRGFPIPQSACNIPSNAQAYSLNVTVVPAGPLGYLTAWPAGQPQPFVSTLNSFSGDIVANAAIVPAGTGGAVSVFVTDRTDVILDINGYFAPLTTASQFYPIPPCRLADTRWPTGMLGGPSMAGGATRLFPVLQSACGIPPTVQAYSLNVTAVPSGPLSYLTAWPAGQPQPLVSTLNSFKGEVVANAAVVPAGAGGAFSIYVTDRTDVVIDINGYFGPPGAQGLNFYAAAPCRVADTRLPLGPFGGPTLPASGTRDIPVPASSCAIPATAKAYSMNVTVVPPGPLSYLTAWPTGQRQPLVSTLNSFLGKVVANAAIVPAGTNGAISMFVTDTTDLVLDINGFFAP